MKWKKNQASDQNLDCWKNNIPKLFFPPEIRERKAMVAFETVSCRNGGICGLKKNKENSGTPISSNAL